MESEHFDIIIIGAGIAGCGLSYNLKKQNSNDKILIIDKSSPGANAAYGYRNTFKDIIDEYNLPYERVYNSVLFGTFQKLFADIPSKFYFINYKQTCEFLLKKSNAIFRKEAAQNIKKNTLITNKKTYTFKFLIDCSGRNFFIKKILKHPLPIRYWVGKTFSLNKTIENKKTYYHIINQEGFLEDIYPFENKTLMGIWKYSKHPYITSPYPRSNISKNLFDEIQIPKTKTALIPCSPTFPIVVKNIAILGDSFGNASTSTAEGIRPILQTSKLLAKNIINNTLANYEKEWKTEHLESYLIQLATKTDYKSRFKLLQILGNNKKIFLDIVKSDRNNIPIQLLIKIPPAVIFSIIKNYLWLKLYYRQQLSH